MDLARAESVEFVYVFFLEPRGGRRQQFAEKKDADSINYKSRGKSVDIPCKLPYYERLEILRL